MEVYQHFIPKSLLTLEDKDEKIILCKYCGTEKKDFTNAGLEDHLLYCKTYHATLSPSWNALEGSLKGLLEMRKREREQKEIVKEFDERRKKRIAATKNKKKRTRKRNK